VTKEADFMVDMVQCDEKATPIADLATDEVAAIIDQIRESYSRRCVKYTGQPPEAAEAPVDRRRASREAITIPFYIQSVSQPGDRNVDWSDIALGPEMIAITRDLSPRGIGFHCDVPILERFYLAEFDSTDDTTVRLLLEVRWVCRKTPHHYIAGGRILRPVYL
jgi:hypothetical protein